MALITIDDWGDRMSAAFSEPVPTKVKGPQRCATEPVPCAIAPTIGVATDITEEIVYFRQIARSRLTGLHCAFGFSGHGYQLDPSVGAVVAELIHTDATRTPIAPCHIGRFAEPLAPAARTLHPLS